MFDINNFGIKKVSMDMVREWAHEASQAYLGSGIEPGFTIEKIASSEDLLPHQIQLLCTETNKLLHTHKYASEADKYHAANFPHADFTKVVENLKITENVKTGSLVECEPVFTKELDLEQYFGVDEGQGQTKTASLKQEVGLKIEKLANFEKTASMIEIETMTALSNAENHFIKQSMHYVNSCDNEADRVNMIGQIYAMSKSAGFEVNGKRLLNKVAHVASFAGLISNEKLQETSNFFLSKEADCKAPESLISENLLGQVRIVNGSHPLYITLQTVNNKETELAKTREYATIAQDQLRILRQKIRAL